MTRYICFAALWVLTLEKNDLVRIEVLQEFPPKTGTELHLFLSHLKHFATGVVDGGEGVGPGGAVDGGINVRAGADSVGAVGGVGGSDIGGAGGGNIGGAGGETTTGGVARGNDRGATMGNNRGTTRGKNRGAASGNNMGAARGSTGGVARGNIKGAASGNNRGVRLLPELRPPQPTNPRRRIISCKIDEVLHRGGKTAREPFARSTMFPALISKSTIFPDQKSTAGDLKLSISDLPMLSCHYIQKGGLFTRPSPNSSPSSSAAYVRLYPITQMFLHSIG
ncbi:hypothetical protein RJ640_017217 [Escallonia rubra]|uniref:Uncharacterized protein n=1 Tax=Escallonia rubra TaxID=112253 RepID=A0AA88RRV3_9ASTE|nr:hypothetical protein RJ640_017217 [Escallonia rubra]